MNNFINYFINWSEVWSLILPLLVILKYKPVGTGVQPLVLYVVIALVLNTMATVMVQYYFSMPYWLKNNNFLYNLHSFVRVVFFSWYIMVVRRYLFSLFMKILLGLYLLGVLINFIFLQSPFLLNSRLFSAESILLLLFCISFFLRSMLDDSDTNWLKHPSFLFITGVILYEATSFFIFLFFYPLVKKDFEFADLTMTIHNVMYIILCILLTVTLYRYRRGKIITI